MTQKATPQESEFELSVVMPCLNEADTLETCISKALRAMREHDIHGEVVVADNGSTDGSIEIAERCGARVVHVTEKGYGNALRGGIASAKGRFVIMGDADDSYDFLEVPKFVEKLREGYDLVMGCRLPGGGGSVANGAMPFLHRWWGNPMFTRMVQVMFRAPIHDVYCGLRGFTKTMYDRLALRCTGMEFATEMVIKSSLTGEKITEVPITLHPDGRKAHAPHLKTFTDGWRTLRFFMLYSPRWLYLVPGVLFGLLGAVGYALALPGATIGKATFDAHTLLFASLFLMVGFQCAHFALLAKVFAIGEQLMPADERIRRYFELFPLERALFFGSLGILAGLILLGIPVMQWLQGGFGPMDYSATMKLVIPGTTLCVLAFQGIMGSFFASILGMRRT